MIPHLGELQQQNSLKILLVLQLIVAVKLVDLLETFQTKRSAIYLFHTHFSNHTNQFKEHRTVCQNMADLTNSPGGFPRVPRTHAEMGRPADTFVPRL